MSYITYPTYVLPNDLDVNSVTASSGFTGSFIGDGSQLTNIPSTAVDLSAYATLAGVTSSFTTPVQVTGAISDALVPYALEANVSSSFVSHPQATASLARLAANNTFTGVNTFQSQVTGTSAYFTGDLYVNGTASVAVLNTVEQQSLKIGDKYITILSGASSQAEMDGAGILFGSASADTPKGEQDSVAHIIYRNAQDQLEVFPGLKVSGSLTASAPSSFTELTSSGGISSTTFSGSSTLQVGGKSTFGAAVYVPMRTVTANDTLSDTNDYIVAFSGSNLTASLPSAAGLNGMTLIVKNTHTSPLFITSTSTIDGGASVTIGTQFNSYTFVSDNSNWLIV